MDMLAQQGFSLADTRADLTPDGSAAVRGNTVNQV